MNRLIKIFSLLTVLFLASCHGYQDPEDSTRFYLSVDKPVIESDGKDVATLTITDINGRVLTEGEDLRKTSFYIEELDEWRSGLGSSQAPNLFTSIVDGRYTISAMYDGVWCKNKVTVTSENRSGYEVFHKNVLIYKLTGTWCQYCPYMTEALHNVDDYTKDHSIVMAFHSGDEFALQYSSGLDMGSMLLRRFGTSDDGYPFAIYSLAEASGKRTVADIQGFVKNQLTQNPAKTGIKAESVVENGKVTVKASVKTSEKGTYDLGIAVLRDNRKAVNYMGQMETYSDVVTLVSGNFYAMSPDAFELSPDGEYQVEKVCEHPEITPGSDCRIVLFTLTEAGGKVIIDNSVALAVGDSVDYRYADGYQGGQEGGFSAERRMVAMQFTSVGCTYCPILSSALKDVQKNLPGKVIPVSFHMDYNGIQDPMTLSVNSKFYEKVNTGDGAGLPLFALNFRKSSQHIVNEYSKIVSEIEYQEEAFPVAGAVAVNSVYDEAAGTASVTARFVSNVPDEFRYHIFLVEDGIEYSQAGADGLYVHDNVLRAMAGDNILGTRLNSGKPLEAGKEYAVTKTFDVKPGWKPSDMRAVAILMRTVDGGETWYSDNAAECALTAPVEVGGEFQRHVCVMEFTGTWCAQCPEGATVLNYLVDRQYKGKAFALAFHNNDEYSIPQEQEFFKIFKWSGYPAYVTDMRDTGLLTGGGCDRTIETSLYDSPTYCGVAVESSYDASTGMVEVTARLASSRSMNYRLAAYVLEDKVKGNQTLGTGQVQKDYTHRHVVRQMLSSTVYGDGLGEVRKGAEVTRTFTFKADEAWNVANLSVAVLAIDPDGHVNNMAQCAADGGKMDYEYINR